MSPMNKVIIGSMVVGLVMSFIAIRIAIFISTGV
jgi:hypothetical protein